MPGPSRSTLPSPATEARSRQIEVDGLRLHVATWEGPATARPAMLLHGGMAHARWWEALAPHIAAFCRPFALDRRGHGESDWDEVSRYGWERDLLDIELAMRELDPGPWLLAGHSQGGLLAVDVALRARVRLAGLILFDIPLEPRTGRLVRLGRAFRRMPQIEYGTREEALRRFQPFPADHRIPPDRLRRLAEASFRPTEEGGYTSRFHWKRFQADADGDRHPLARFSARLRELRVPTLVLRGEESTILSRADFREMVGRIPRAVGEEIAGATHNLHVEQPVRTASAIERFLRPLPPAQSAP